MRRTTVAKEGATFGFGKVACVFCDRPVPRKETLRIRDRRDVGQDVGVFLDRYAFGHADCGALQVTA